MLRASTSKASVQNGSHTLNGGMLNLNGYTLTMTSLSGSGVIIALVGISLTLAQASDTTFVGGMAGTGVFTRQGQGALFFTNDNSSFTRTVRTAEGHLIAGEAGTGTLGGKLESVLGVRLSSSFTVGNTIEGAGSTTAPGNLIGILTVDGDFILTSGSVY